jgi:Holliday junction resolvase RusA-like endonuclease
VTTHPIVFDVDDDTDVDPFAPELLLSLRIPGKPRGFERPRFSRKTGTVFNSKSMAAWERKAATMMSIAWRQTGRTAPIDSPLQVDIVSVHERPQRLIPRNMGGTMSEPGAKRVAQSLGVPRRRLPFVGKPDIDNIAKIVLDSLTKGGVMTDDTRVASLVCSKVYTALRHDSPGVEVAVWRLTP